MVILTNPKYVETCITYHNKLHAGVRVRIFAIYKDTKRNYVHT